MLSHVSTRLLKSAAAITLLFSAMYPPGALGQAVYTWVDPQGRVHYSDKPAAGQRNAQVSALQLPAINLLQATTTQPDVPARRAKKTANKRSSRQTHAAAADCQSYRTKIRAIEQQLRQGYSEPSGAKLHRSKRKWSELLYSRCY